MPDLNNAWVMRGGEKKSCLGEIKDKEWVNNVFIKDVARRGAAIIEARKLSSAASAASSVCDHVHDWFAGTRPG